VYGRRPAGRQFDYVIFMGLLYHLRYPFFALDKWVKKVRGRLVFQTMIRGSKGAPRVGQGLSLLE